MTPRAFQRCFTRLPSRPSISTRRISISLSRPTLATVPTHTGRALSTICLARHFPTRAQRRFATSSPRARPSEAAQSFPDPDRPDLFYHLYTPPTALSATTPVFALSFLETPPPLVLSASVVGWLPASGEGEGAGLNDFVENESFREALHEAIESALGDGMDDIQLANAIQTGEGWMHIHDNRNLPALGRIGDPDDIIASVRVENGEILAETYQPMPSYRLCTSDGVVQLTDGLAARLVEVLQKRVRDEENEDPF